MFAALLIICFLSGNDMLPLEIEPKCTSKFDFEEKLLEKVIRMEVKLETLANKVEQDLLKFDKGVASFKLEFQDMLSRTNESISNINDNYVELEGKAEKTLSEVNLKFDILKEKADVTFTELQENATRKLAEIRDVALKKDVVFHVKDLHGQPTANNVMKFTNVVINTGNVYNLDTGFFTAPKNGTYWFAAQICTYTNDYISPSIHINGVVMNRIYTRDKSEGDCSTVNAVAILQTGETATLKAGPHLTINPVWSSDSHNSNNFMGALIN